MYSFVNDFPDTLLRVKCVGGATHNNKWLITVTCAICWINYCITEIKFSIDTVYSPYQVKICMILQITVIKNNLYFTSMQ